MHYLTDHLSRDSVRQWLYPRPQRPPDVAVYHSPRTRRAFSDCAGSALADREHVDLHGHHALAQHLHLFRATAREIEDVVPATERPAIVDHQADHRGCGQIR